METFIHQALMSDTSLCDDMISYHKSKVDFGNGERIIGFTVLSGAFIFLPLFLYHRWSGKRLKDYTLSEENFKKMKVNMSARSRIKKTEKH